ncbi:FKBP-type peptidyl-prolyl cis-trans isomerase [Planctomicrobium sp. SH527]|uniref:FKBP-type peptidyl-prolyl cis-trans isomerase n=1 Tax=Planctomicrobium sp. SH527 TaxID=3448123 RepID=UPI003F5BFA55
MKLSHCMLFACLLSVGCVAGPDEIAADKQSKKETMERNAADLAKAGESDEPAGEVQMASGETGSSAASTSATAFKTTNNGLKYKIIKEGTGKRPTARSTVSCHYRGWLDNGKEFDSSYKRGEPTEFPLNGVIAGWTEGLQLIKEGGEIELDIPSRLGYGEGGMPGAIPPNARLHFTIELLKVK